MNKISIAEAVQLLQNDSTGRKTVYFLVDDNRGDSSVKIDDISYCRDTVEVDGNRYGCITVDRGQLSNIKNFVMSVSSKTLMYGIYTL